MKFFLIISVFLFINFVLLLLPKLMPNYIKPSQTVFWLIWTNSLFIFSMVLPHQTSYIFPNAKSVMNIANIFKNATSGEEKKQGGPNATPAAKSAKSEAAAAAALAAKPPAPEAPAAPEAKSAISEAKSEANQSAQEMRKRIEQRKNIPESKKASAKKAKKESKKPVVVVESNTSSSKTNTPGTTKNNSPSIVVVKETSEPQ